MGTAIIRTDDETDFSNAGAGDADGIPDGIQPPARHNFDRS